MSSASTTSRAKDIFLTARIITDGDERTRFLQQACREDAGLLERVQALLEADAGAAGFLDAPVTVEPTPGDKVGYFGDYILLDEIARGSNGVVFRARQVSLDRVVALKMLRDRPELTNDVDVQRLHAEAKAAAALDHPNILPIYEVGSFDGQPYFSMKLITGGTLQFRMAEYQQDVRKAVALMIKVARAMQHAHSQGILHRDLKPGNILIDNAGEPHITDFGLARKIGLDSSSTMTGQVMGTPLYMSPEQARGGSKELTPATDIYSLGTMLYELIEGRLPFQCDDLLDLIKQVAEKPAPAAQTSHRALAAIAMKCLEKQPTARYATADALADDLEAWLRGERLEKTVARWSRRRFAYAALAVGSVAAFFWLPERDRIPSALDARSVDSAGAEPPAEGFQFYKIKNISSNKVLAIDDRINAEEGAPIFQLMSGPKNRQLWRFVKDGAFYKIINLKSGLALTVQDASMEAGAKIVQSDPRGERENQQWTLQKTEAGYVLKARHSGQVLDVENGAFKPKAPIIQYPITEGRNQFFELERVNTTDIPDPL